MQSTVCTQWPAAAAVVPVPSSAGASTAPAHPVRLDSTMATGTMVRSDMDFSRCKRWGRVALRGPAHNPEAGRYAGVPEEERPPGHGFAKARLATLAFDSIFGFAAGGR